MPLILIGLSTGPEFYGSAGRKPTAADDLALLVGAVAAKEPVNEVCALSTAHRTELYVVGDDIHSVYTHAVAALAEHLEVSIEAVGDNLYLDTGTSVVAHLVRFAYGVGDAAREPDPTGAVNHAWETARTVGASRSSLNLLFHHSLEAARSFRSSESCTISPQAQSAVAAAFRQHQGTALAVVVIGAGRGAEDIVRAAQVCIETGAIVVAHHDEKKAERVAERCGVVADGIGHLSELIDWADVMFCTADTPATAIDAAELSAASVRRERPLVVCDLTSNQSVDGYCDENVSMVDPAALTAASLTETAVYVADAVRSWEDKTARRDKASVIAALHKAANDLREKELQRHATVMRSMTPEQQAAMVALSRGVVAKLLHAPSVSLRAASNMAHAEKISSIALELFQIERLPSA